MAPTRPIMPSAPRRYAEWTPKRFRRWGASAGPNTERLMIVASDGSRPGHPGVFGWVSNSGIYFLVINHKEDLMPAKRELTMRQIRNILRLASEGISARQIGRLLGAVRSTIQDNLKRAQVAGLAWPLPADLTDAVLEERLFAHNGAVRGVRRRAEPVWSELVCELKRPAVNLMVLWEEYRAGHPEEYSYSRFCDLFRKFEARLSPVMRQEHRAGDKVFVDYSGKKLGITDPATGEVRFAEIFVAVLGASSYILGRLRAQKFFSLAETNQAIAGMVARINDHIMRRLGGSRRHLFETIERPALAVLPDVDYEFAEWGFACVSLDYHVEVCWYLYSVPHNLIRAQVDSRILARLVIIH